MAKVTIDRDGCISCGICWGSCPEVYEQNDNDSKCQINTLLQQMDDLAEATIDDSLAECARSGADSCPVSVIIVE